jgi:hypothetical protein
MLVPSLLLCIHFMRSAKATSRFAREVEVISRWLSSALPPEFSDEKLFMATYGQDQRRLPIVQEITKSVELLKGKVEKWKAKGAAERAATAKSSEEFARLVFEDIQRNVTALVNIEASYAVCSAHARARDAPLVAGRLRARQMAGLSPRSEEFLEIFRGRLAGTPMPRACHVGIVYAPHTRLILQVSFDDGTPLQCYWLRVYCWEMPV